MDYKSGMVHSEADQENVIVVSINYRLSAHGFLGYNSTYGDTINNGIMDQMNAIKWTSQFIQQFGGDLEKIMLADESAGATSVNIHMANNETNQLFDKAILESNPAGINLKPASDQRKLFRQLAKKVGCNGLNDNFTDDRLWIVSSSCTVTSPRAWQRSSKLPRLSPTPILSCTLMYGG